MTSWAGLGVRLGWGAGFRCERAQGLGLTAGVQYCEDTEGMCVASYRN